MPPAIVTLAARLLGMHPDYRVQRRLAPVTHFHAASSHASSRIGLAIHVKATRLDRPDHRAGDPAFSV